LTENGAAGNAGQTCSPKQWQTSMLDTPCGIQEWSPVCDYHTTTWVATHEPPGACKDVRWMMADANPERGCRTLYVRSQTLQQYHGCKAQDRCLWTISLHCNPPWPIRNAAAASCSQTPSCVQVTQHPS
jgi:hypothetical protein